MRDRMKAQLLEAFDHPEAKNCFYSFNMKRTGVPRLDALNMFDWTPEHSLDVPGNTTCLFPLGLGCQETRTSDGVLWASPMFNMDEARFSLDPPDVWSGYTGTILRHIQKMAANLTEGERIREPDIQSPLGVAEILCGESLYTGLYEHPEAVKAMLSVIAEFEIAFIKAMHEVAGEKLNGCCFPLIWHNHEGTLCSDDTLTLLSPAMHRDFSIPYINMIADACGPLFYHSCTWLPEHFDNIKQVRNVRAYNWTLGGPTDPRDIIREFSGRGVIAPHLCKDVHTCPETRAWGNFSDEAAIIYS